jgi:UDP-N-acetylglucosamine 2-epimerase
MWKDDGNEIVQYYTNMLKEKYLISKYSKVILYTVDPQNNRDKEIIKAIQNSPSDWFWFVRVHPKRVGMLEYTRKRIGDTKCGFAIDNIHLLPLYSFFKVCDVHITERSSTIIEAANFGIKSIVTSKYSYESFKRFVDSGKIVYCCKWKEILKCAKGLKRDKDDIKEGKEDDIIKLVKMIEEI